MDVFCFFQFFLFILLLFPLAFFILLCYKFSALVSSPPSIIIGKFDEVEVATTFFS